MRCGAQISLSILEAKKCYVINQYVDINHTNTLDITIQYAHFFTIIINAIKAQREKSMKLENTTAYAMYVQESMSKIEKEIKFLYEKIEKILIKFEKEGKNNGL